MILVLSVLCGVQGHPHERSHQPTGQHLESSSPSSQTITDVVEDNGGIDSAGTTIPPSDSHPSTAEPPKVNASSVSEIGQEFHPSHDESLCSYREAVILPKMWLNQEREWRYIINEGNFTQGIKVELCETERAPCRFSEGFYDGYEAYCKQKFSYIPFTAVARDGSSFVHHFRFPVSCCCHMRRTENPMIRGLGID